MTATAAQSVAVLWENRFVGPAWGGLFHSPDFHRLHAGDVGRYLEWAVDGRVRASIHFTAEAEGLWRSPARGTFAGYAWDPGLPLDSLWAFHAAVMQRLADVGAARVQILTAPMAHDPVAFSQQTHMLRSTGFEISRCDLNQSMTLGTLPLAQRMSRGNLKRLNKCAREGIVARCLPASALPEVVDTLMANREAKGHTLSMTREALATMQRAFPERMHLYGATLGSGLVAAALCLRISQDVLYVFYWGDRPGHAQLSPVVALAEAIDRHARELGVQQLCVGTSTLDRAPNHGLLQFKRNLGFSESLKLQFSRRL